MATINLIIDDLNKALSESKKDEDNLAKAKSQVETLEAALLEKRKTIADLMRQYQAESGFAPAAGRRGRRSTGEGKRNYSTSPEKQIQKAIKTARTRATNKGLPHKEIEKLVKEAEAAAKAKYGGK